MNKTIILLLLLFGMLMISVGSNAEDSDEGSIVAKYHGKYSQYVVGVEITQTFKDDNGEESSTVVWTPGVRISDSRVVFSAHKLPEDPVKDTKYRIYQGKVAARAELKGVNLRSNIALVQQVSGSPNGLSFSSAGKIEVGQRLYAAAITSSTSKYNCMILPFRITAVISHADDSVFTTDLVLASLSNPNLVGIAAINASGKVVGFINFVRGDANNTLVLFPSKYIRKAIGTAIDPRDTSLRRCWFGAFTSELVSEWKEKLDLPGDLQGALVESVIPKSPAAIAKLQSLDVIFSINGVAIAGPDAADLNKYFSDNFRPGKKVKLGIFRDKKRIEVVVELLESPATYAEADKYEDKGLGMQVCDLTIGFRINFGLKTDDEGVIVTNVKFNLPFDSAARQTIGMGYSLRNGVVVTKVDDVKISNVKDFEKAVKKARDNCDFTTFFVRYNRKDETGCFNTSFIRVTFED